MAGNGSQQQRRHKAVTALLSSRTMEEAAREAGVSARTLRRWNQSAEFRHMLHEARRENYARENARLQQGSPAAVSTLLKTLIDPKTRESVRVGIAKFVLESAQKTLEIEALEIRLSQVERNLAADRTPNHEVRGTLNDTAEPEETA